VKWVLKISFIRQLSSRIYNNAVGLLWSLLCLMSSTFKHCCHTSVAVIHLLLSYICCCRTSVTVIHLLLPYICCCHTSVAPNLNLITPKHLLYLLSLDVKMFKTLQQKFYISLKFIVLFHLLPDRVKNSFTKQVS